jgi:hypothetical protein
MDIMSVKKTEIINLIFKLEEKLSPKILEDMCIKKTCYLLNYFLIYFTHKGEILKNHQSSVCNKFKSNNTFWTFVFVLFLFCLPSFQMNSIGTLTGNPEQMYNIKWNVHSNIHSLRNKDMGNLHTHKIHLLLTLNNSKYKCFIYIKQSI